MLDGAVYVFQQAEALGQPAVVNLSIGYNIGTLHDGSGLIEEGYDFLVNSRSGFMMCVSAGNEAFNKLIHFGAELSQTPVWTYVPNMNETMLDAFFLTDLLDSTFIQVMIDSAFVNDNEDSLLGQETLHTSSWMSLREIKNSSTGVTITANFANNKLAGRAKLVASKYDSTRTELRVYTLANGYNLSPILSWLRLAFKGSGTFHSWWETYQVGLSNPMGLVGRKDDPQFKISDNNYSMNILATGKKTFSVGVYVNKPTYTDINGGKQRGANIRWDSTGALAIFSSLGPTGDGRIKPDFCAPGLNVASSYSRNSPGIASAFTDPYTTVKSGTSMSSPVAAGAIALYLQKRPTATFDEIYNALTTTTNKDSLTYFFGALPNNHFGYGRLNIFKAMGGVTYVNEEQGNKINYTTVSVFPNPTASVVTFILSELNGTEKLTVYDVNGKSVAEIMMKENAQQLDISSWKKGVYTFQISGKGQKYVGKFMVN